MKHRSRNVNLLFLFLNLSWATHGAIHRGPRTVQSIAGNARCHRWRATRNAIDRAPFAYCFCISISRGPRTVPSIAAHARCHRSRADYYYIVIISKSRSSSSSIFVVICRGPRMVPSIAHRLRIVFAFKSLVGHARCHQSRVTHGAIDRALLLLLLL